MEGKHVANPGGHAQQHLAQDPDVVEVLGIDGRLSEQPAGRVVLVEPRVRYLDGDGDPPRDRLLAVAQEAAAGLTWHRVRSLQPLAQAVRVANRRELAG